MGAQALVRDENGRPAEVVVRGYRLRKARTADRWYRTLAGLGHFEIRTGVIPEEHWVAIWWPPGVRGRGILVCAGQTASDTAAELDKRLFQMKQSLQRGP
jgi:hypothetical protein